MLALAPPPLASHSLGTTRAASRLLHHLTFALASAPTSRLALACASSRCLSAPSRVISHPLPPYPALSCCILPSRAVSHPLALYPTSEKWAGKRQVLIHL
ncbi:hypothetical protein DENSPDRAFT_885452 [Dentipellis sp. KUC8613]|nr:hypothetical protein DENSPDRAFT_885452 [Dentipellis sp. KUC8613]